MANNSTNKRLLQESDNDEGPNARRMRLHDMPSSSSAMLGALSGTRMQEAVCSALETLCQRVMHEELERAIVGRMGSMRMSPSSTLRIKEAKPSSTNMQLVFEESLPQKLFTKVNLVEGQLEIKLVDVPTGQVVQRPRTPIKVEIVVLHGDFPSSKSGGDWTSEEFDSNIVKHREGRRPLLVGDQMVVVLREGKAAIDGDLQFTDNSSWTRSSTFRLGVRVVPGSYAGERIKEAISKKPFKVLDRRGEAYKKHYPPRLHDKVWRLEKIGKDGSLHKKLEKEGITTVQDFLRLLTVYPRHLQSIVGQGSEHWVKTVNHAKTCNIGPELLIYHGQKFSVILDNTFQVRGIKYSDNIWRSTKELTSQQLDEAKWLAAEAYKNRSHLQEMSPTERSALQILEVSSTKTGNDRLPEETADSNTLKQGYASTSGSLEYGLLPEAEDCFGNDDIPDLELSAYHSPPEYGLLQSLYDMDIVHLRSSSQCWDGNKDQN